MKFFSKYEGLLPELIHSPAAYGIKGKDFTFSAACRPARDGEVPESLELHLDRREIISMPATDTFTLGECRYEIYSVTVPGNKLSADCVSYMIAVPGVLTSVTRTFVMQLIDPAEIPEIPPVRVTEIYARPKGLGVTSYIEVVNPSGKETDLYEYELLVCEHLNTGLSDLSAPVHESFTVRCLDIIFFNVLSQLLDDTLIDTVFSLLIYDVSSQIIT